MADEITYSEPIETRTYAGTTTLKVEQIEARRTEQYLRVLITGDNGVRFTAEWRGADVQPLLQAINAGSFAPKTLNRWLLEQAMANGKVPGGGTIT